MDFSKLTSSCTLYKAMNYNNFYGSKFLFAVDKDRCMRVVLHARFYTTYVRNYCSVHLHVRDQYGFGVAYAQGYGYDRASTALASALKAAGVGEVSGIAGTGMSHAIFVVREELGRELGMELQEFQSYA